MEVFGKELAKNMNLAPEWIRKTLDYGKNLPFDEPISKLNDVQRR